MNQHCQKSIIASLEDNNAKMKEQIEKSSKIESKNPSKTSAVAFRSLYISLITTAPVLPSYPNPPVMLDNPPNTPGGTRLQADPDLEDYNLKTLEEAVNHKEPK